MRKLLYILAFLTCALPLRAQTPSCGFPQDAKIHAPYNPSMKATITSTSTTSAVATIVLTSAPAWTPIANEVLVYEGSSNSAMNSFIGEIGTITDSQHFTVTFTGQPNGTSTGGFVAPVDWNAHAVPASAGGSYTDGLGALPGGLGGCTVYRLTADGDSTHDYSTVTAADFDNKYVLVHGGTNGDRYIGGCPGASCGVVIVNSATINGTCSRNGDAWRLWDPLHDNVQYYTNGLSLMKCTINGTNSLTSTTVHTFPEYQSWVAIPDESDLLPDGCQLTLVGQNPAVGGASTFDIFNYNLCTNTKSHLFTTNINGCVNNPPTGFAESQPGNGGCIHKIIMMADGTPVVQFEGSSNNGDPNITATGCAPLIVSSCNLSVGPTGTLTFAQGDPATCNPHGGCSSHFDRSENQAGTVSYIAEVDEPPGFGNQPADPCFVQNGADIKDYTTATNTSPGTVNCWDTLANVGHMSSHFVSSTMPYALMAMDPSPAAGQFTTTSSHVACGITANYTAPSTNATSFATSNNYSGTPSVWFYGEDAGFLVNVNARGSTTGPGLLSGTAYEMYWTYTDSDDNTIPATNCGFWLQSRDSLNQSGTSAVFDSSMACPNGVTGVSPCLTGRTLGDVYEVTWSFSGVPLNPTSQSFGGVLVGSSSAPFTFTLTNNSGATITGITVSNVGGATADFVNQGTGTCGSTLANGSSCTIIYVFTPSTGGIETTTLNVADSDPSSPQQSSLSGVGTFPLNNAPAPAIVMFAEIEKALGWVHGKDKP